MDTTAPLFHLTIGELQELIRKEVIQAVKTVQPEGPSAPWVARGLRGLAEALGVSRATAYNYKRMGLLEGTYIQLGKTIIFDMHKVIASKSLCELHSRRKNAIALQQRGFYPSDRTNHPHN